MKFRNSLSLLILLLSAGNISAQVTECKVKLSQLPVAAELSGFRIGMTMDQVKARVPQVSFGRTDQFGTSKTSINPYFDPKIDKSGFADVRTVSLEFLDGRVTSLWFGYEPTFKWPTVETFVKGISLALSLPPAWSPWKSQGQQLKCADFQVTVSLVARGPSFRLLDLTSEEILTARRVAQEEENEELENSEPAAEFVADSVTKFYYPADCELAKGVSESHRTSFKTALEAEKAGYKPAKECKP
ncbi:MAG TPA: hypothetical protein VFH01_04670 [Pyrinomonadaceae bacterium]|nr:hypothetical protein [Pyrinomonadaceae bacterium]